MTRIHDRWSRIRTDRYFIYYTSNPEIYNIHIIKGFSEEIQIQKRLEH